MSAIDFAGQDYLIFSMVKKSAGILAYRLLRGIPEVLLVHPGGPFFKNKDIGFWTVPKGEIEPDEDILAAAKREFAEEMGFDIDGIFYPLNPIKQKNGKIVFAWCVEVFVDTEFTHSNTFSIEWPPHSGKMEEFPEVDKAEWFTFKQARVNINAAQVAFLDELSENLAKKQSPLIG